MSLPRPNQQWITLVISLFFTTLCGFLLISLSEPVSWQPGDRTIVTASGTRLQDLFQGLRPNRRALLTQPAPSTAGWCSRTTNGPAFLLRTSYEPHLGYAFSSADAAPRFRLVQGGFCNGHYMTMDLRFCNVDQNGEWCYYDWYYADATSAPYGAGYTDGFPVCDGACNNEESCWNDYGGGGGGCWCGDPSPWWYDNCPWWCW